MIAVDIFISEIDQQYRAPHTATTIYHSTARFYPFEKYYLNILLTVIRIVKLVPLDYISLCKHLNATV